ncbi:MAG: sulfotransferase domain-containing protein [Minwuia sp.]|nr:sulfotransferase domain-containing protein [Minwuia sp.]
MGGIYWLASYPKSGNTWFRTFLQNLMSVADTPTDINKLNTGSIASSRNWIDDVIGFDTSDLRQDEIESLRPHVYRWMCRGDGVAYHKIHDAYTHTGEGRPLVDDIATLGALYIIRNPLDVAPSYAGHRNCSIDDAIGSMGDPRHALARSQKALPDQLLQFVGTWSQHVISWVDAERLNVKVIRYEDMHATPDRTFGSAADFLGLDTDTERRRRAIDFSSFDIVAGQEARSGFRERPPQAERFFRKGVAGDWRESLTDAQVTRIIADHGIVMSRFGYLDAAMQPV